MVTAMCEQCLRMRHDMSGLPVDEQRIAETTRGKIKPLGMTA